MTWDEQNQKEVENNWSDLERAHERIEKLEAEREELRSRVASASLTIEAFGTKLAQVAEERNELRRRLESHESRLQSAQKVWLARSAQDDPLPCVIPAELVEHVRKNDKARTAVEVYLVPIEGEQQGK